MPATDIPSAPHDAPEDEFLSLRTTATGLDVSEETVRNWIESGLLPAWRFGPRIIRIRRRDLLAMAQPVTPGRGVL